MSSSRRKTAGGTPGAVFAYQTTSCYTNYYHDVNMLYCCEFVVAEYAAKFGVEWLFIGW